MSDFIIDLSTSTFVLDLLANLVYKMSEKVNYAHLMFL